MVFKGGAGNKDPREQLRKIADDDKRRGFVAAENRKISADADCREPCPAKHGIEKRAEGGAGAAAVILKVVQYRPFVDEPLIPAGGVGVLRVNPGVVGEHEVLILQDDIRVVLCEEHTRAVQPARLTVGEVAEVVNRGGHKHEKDRAEQAVFYKLTQPEIAYPADEPDEGKSCARVKAGPLAGGADAEENSRQGKISEPAAADVQVHEQVHEQDEEHRVGVDGGDAGLGEMHEVEGKHRRTAGRNRRTAEHSLEENIQHRQHQDSEQSARKAPSEGRHAEKPDAGGDNELTQRGMGYLVGINALDMLKGGAGVIDLVKIRAVEIGLISGNNILLVAKLCRGAGVFGKFSAAFYGKLAEIHIAARRQADIAGHGLRAVIKLGGLPFEKRRVALLKLTDVRPVKAVGGVFQPVRAGIQPRIEHEPVDLRFPSEVEDYTLVIIKMVE